MSEIPVHSRPRRLADWINPTGAKKVHSSIDKVYKRKNLEMAWEMVRANRGSGGVDGQSLDGFAAQLDQQLDRLQSELKEDVYRPQPVRQVQIPKAGKPGEFRMLGIPTIYDRVCQQALLNRLEPIFEPVFDEANFGYRRGRSTKDAMRKVWKEIQSGREWIVDADLKDFFGSVDHTKLLTLVAQRVADGRVLRLIEAMLKAGSYGKGRLFPTERGTPQGGVVSPLLSNVLLTPFDQEMRRKGYQLTRYADDWVVTCESATEARAAVAAALRILNELGVQLHPQKTRIVHVRQGFEFLGYKIKRGQRQLHLSPGKIRSGVQPGALYAYPREKSIRHFMDQVRALTSRRVPLRTTELIEELNPVLRGWGHHYKRAHVRKLFHRLDGWIVRRIRSHRCKRWRNGGWRQLPETKLYVLEAVGEGTKMADHPSPVFHPAFPSSAIISERSSPSRVRFAAPNNGAPLTPPGRSGQHCWEDGKAHSERPPWQGTTSPPFWYPFSPPPTAIWRVRACEPRSIDSFDCIPEA